MLETVPTLTSWTEYTVVSGTDSQAMSHRSHSSPPQSHPSCYPGPRRLPSPQFLLDNISASTFMELASQRLAMQKAWAHHAVRRAQSEARVFQVNTIIHTRKYISIQTLIKIRTKVGGWETRDVRTLEEAMSLARWEA